MLISGESLERRVAAFSHVSLASEHTAISEEKAYEVKVRECAHVRANECTADTMRVAPAPYRVPNVAVSR